MSGTPRALVWRAFHPMKTPSCFLAPACGALFAASLIAQPAPPTTAPSASSSETVQLSPFLVSTEGDEGYRAANTLSGTRMNAPRAAQIWRRLSDRLAT